jgi:hypothetical protein
MVLWVVRFTVVGINYPKLVEERHMRGMKKEKREKSYGSREIA